MRSVTLTVHMHEPSDPDVTNEDRALMVEPLLWAFAEAYYRGDITAMREEGLLLDYVVSDFFADLWHWCDRRHVIIDFDPTIGAITGRVGFLEQVAHAQVHHDEELEDERIHDDRPALCDWVLDDGRTCNQPAPHCWGGEIYLCDEHKENAT